MKFIHLIVEFTLSIDHSSSLPPAKQFVLNMNRNSNTKSALWVVNPWLAVVLAFYCFVDIIKINN
jgi:hypothetical protein